MVLAMRQRWEEVDIPCRINERMPSLQRACTGAGRASMAATVASAKEHPRDQPRTAKPPVNPSGETGGRRFCSANRWTKVANSTPRALRKAAFWLSVPELKASRS